LRIEQLSNSGSEIKIELLFRSSDLIALSKVWLVQAARHRKDFHYGLHVLASNPKQRSCVIRVQIL